MLRQRPQKTQIPDPHSPPKSKTGAMTSMGGIDDDDPRQPLLSSTTVPAKEARKERQALSERHATSPTSQEASTLDEPDSKAKMENLSKKSQWIILALASGGCAAFNGVFAKLYVILSCCPESSEFVILPVREE